MEAMGSGLSRVVARASSQARSGRRWEMRLMQKGFLFPATRREFDRQTRGEVVRLTSRLAVRAEDAQHHRNEDQQFGSAGCPRAARPAQSRTEEEEPGRMAGRQWLRLLRSPVFSLAGPGRSSRSLASQ